MLVPVAISTQQSSLSQFSMERMNTLFLTFFHLVEDLIQTTQFHETSRAKCDSTRGQKLSRGRVNVYLEAEGEVVRPTTLPQHSFDKHNPPVAGICTFAHIVLFAHMLKIIPRTSYSFCRRLARRCSMSQQICNYPLRGS
jgi:hypothetical protein